MRNTSPLTLGLWKKRWDKLGYSTRAWELHAAVYRELYPV